MEMIDSNGTVFEAGSVHSYADVAAHPERFPLYTDVIGWIQSFITKPHQELGRQGDVCPAVAHSLQNNLMKFATIRTTESSSEEAARKCEPIVREFFRLFPDRQDWGLASLMIVFPDVAADDAAAFIDGGHRRLRKTFITNGLMLGEFHARSAVGGASNKAFRPMRSPVPVFAVRAISEHDHKFLIRSEFPAEERLECFETFMRFVGEKLNEETRSHVESVMEQLRLELAAV